MNHQLIEGNFNLSVFSIKLLDRHFGTEIYLINTDTGKYIVKVMPLCAENINREGVITEYLYNHGLKVARFLKSKENDYAVKTSEFQFTVQHYIEGITLPVNSAPEWFISKSADFLGKAVLLLKDYKGLPLRFGKEFFSAKTALEKRQHYVNELAQAKEAGDMEIVPIWEEQIRHIEKISEFRIDTEKLTYANSHGDYNIGQAIVNDNDITVIDWTSACRLPICLDVITSYVFASPACTEGAIDAEGLKKYIRKFAEKFPLTDYDIETMPYVLYFWHCVCNYRPDELANIAESYRPIAKLVYSLLNWLYDHVEELSEQLME